MTRAFSSLVVILGAYLLIHAGYQEFRGDTIRPLEYLPFTREAILDHRHNGYQFHFHVLKQNNPELFRRDMTAHWVWAVLIFGIGLYLNASEYRPPEPKAEAETESPAP